MPDIIWTRLQEQEKEGMRHLHEALSERLAPAKEEIRRRREEQERRMQEKLNEVARTSDTLLKGMRAELVALKATSLSVDEGHKYVDQAVEKAKSSIQEKHGHDLNELRSQCKKAYREMNAEIRLFKTDQFKEVADAAWTSSAPKLAAKIREQLVPEISSKIQNQVKETVDASTPELQAKLSELVQTQVRSHLENSKAYDNLLKESEGFKALHTRVQAVDKLLKEMEPAMKGLERMESKVKEFDSKLAQLTQMADALMQHRGGSGSSSVEDSELLKTLSRRMDEMRTELSGTVDQLKTSENMVHMRYREIEQYLSPPNDTSEPAKKRQRVSESSAAEGGGESNLSSTIDDLMSKFQILERKHTHMVEYIEQFRTTTLHPEFPNRLQEVVANLFSNQQNHEGFLAHLVDPVAASSGQQVNLTVAPEGTPSPDTPVMSPAMMQAIQQLVQKKVDEQVSKHVSRLNELEKQYQQRQGGSSSSTQ